VVGAPGTGAGNVSEVTALGLPAAYVTVLPDANPIADAAIAHLSLFSTALPPSQNETGPGSLFRGRDVVLLVVFRLKAR